MTVSTCSTNNSEIIGTILNSRTPHIARNKEWVKVEYKFSKIQLYLISHDQIL